MANHYRKTLIGALIHDTQNELHEKTEEEQNALYDAFILAVHETLADKQIELALTLLAVIEYVTKKG